MPLSLRPYQEEAVAKFVERIDATPRGGLVVLPTGTGKSLVMAAITQWWLEHRKGGVGIASHRKELVSQNAKEYDGIVGVDGECLIEQGADNRVTLAEWDKVRKGGVVSFTVQSLQNRRMHRVSRDAIGLILVDECFTGDTEILTESGFVRFDSLLQGVRVAGYSSGDIEFVIPDRYIENDYSGPMVHVHSTRGCDLIMTPGHEVIVRDGGVDRKHRADSVAFGYGKDVYVAGKAKGSSSRKLTPMERLMIALQADGYNQSSCSKTKFSLVGFSFSKERKIIKFLSLMKEGGFDWTECRGVAASGNSRGCRKFLVKSLSGASKNLWDHFSIGDMDSSLAREIVDEMSFWDGYIDSDWPLRRYYSSTDARQADFFQTVAVLAGYKTFVSVQKDSRKITYKDVHRVYVDTSSDRIGTKHFKKDAVDYVGKVYCVSVPSGNIVVRRNGKVVVTGNCHRIKDQGQYLNCLNYFNCKWVGLTATPDRTDGQRLVPQMFDQCWYGDQPGQQLADFVENGWLVPPRIQHVHVGSLQWKWLRGRSGKDFTSDQVAKVWQDYKSIQEFVSPIVKETGTKKTLYFCPKVSEAKAVADVINGMSHPRRIADYVASYRIGEDGNRSDYPKLLRRSIIERLGRIEDELQHVANMGVFVEGTNVPIISAIAWLRFTKSRLLLAQGLGRAFRTWPGILNGLEHSTAAARRAAINASPKPYALIFDPTKRAGTKLRLAHAVDVLDPAMSPEVRERANALIARKASAGEAFDPRDIIEEAKALESPFFRGLRAALTEIVASVDYKLVEVDPYSGNAANWSRPQKQAEKVIGDAGEKQKKLIRMLARVEYSPDFYERLSRKQAGAVIDKLMKEPCVPWIRKKCEALGITKVPATNSEGLGLMRR